MFKRSVFTVVLLLLTAGFSFGQAAALREYVGLITIQYHPEVVSLMTRVRDNFQRRGLTDAARGIDTQLQGLSGSGFIFVAPDGRNFVLTNEHVVSHAHSLSITFERQDGGRTTFDRLNVLMVDEENDLAILYFEDDRRPFRQGLRFSTTGAEEGGEVFAAGFPGMGTAAVWQFSSGRVSNAFVRLPRSFESDETIGPFIQHTAPIDFGNSGGPLLVAASGVPTGFAVVGINTLSARWRQAANFAIPINRVNDFIAEALSTEPRDERALVARRVDDFLRGLDPNRAVFEHIAGFLSNECAATNAEFATIELVNRAPRTVVAEIDRIYSNSFPQGMRASVGWLIENTMRTSRGALNVSLDSITPNDLGGFTVAFDVNGRIVQSEWIREYGIYRMNSFGNITGDRSLVDQRRRQQAVRTNYSVMLSAGYAYVFGHGSAFNASFGFRDVFGKYGIHIFAGSDYLNVSGTWGFVIPIRVNTLGILPFVDLGGGIIRGVEGEPDFLGDQVPEVGISGSLTAGVMFTTAAVPGLIGRAFYRHEFVWGTIDSHGILGLAVGFVF